MTAIKRLLLESNYRIIGFGTAGLALLLLAIIFGIVEINIIAKDSFVVQTSMGFILLSPLIAIVLTSLRLRVQNCSSDTFERWVKSSFINFVITVILLSVAGLLITKQKDIFHQLFFERVYIILLVPLIGLAVSVLSTVIFKRNF